MPRPVHTLAGRATAAVRRAGGPRLIEWTGERCVPWTPDVQTAYEHYHRYLWAAQLVGDCRVLDLASGEGFGSAILAEQAKSVTGVDIDQSAVAHSRLNYRAPNLEFHVGDVRDLSRFEAGSFDAVVAFEIIEHLTEHEQVLAEVDRVLAPDGLLVLSTPDRLVYSDGHGQNNPYHLRELDEDELRALLGNYFEHYALWGQRTITGSRIGALDDGADQALPLFVEHSGDGWRECAEGTPLYLIAVASHGPVDRPAAESLLADYGLELMRVQERAAQAAQAELQAAREHADERERLLDDTRAQAARQGAAHQEELRRLTHEVVAARADAEHARVAADEAARRLARYEQSVTWTAFQKARGKLYGTIGDDSLAARALQASLRGAGRRLRSRPRPGSAPPPARTIRFPQFDEPMVSLVIPVHAQADLTAACLRSILLNTEAPTYEVVLVDDTADDATKHLLRSVENAQILVNERNLGFLRSMNTGCAAARGRYVVLFNNDTEVQPGWLERMVERAESAPDIGAVAPMLLYPDGVLQEAGGIVFRDGSAWNFGKGDHAHLPQYNYVREVDYGSAAALLVRKQVWDRIGGFDERYAPIYYEDTDLCFALRDHGYRVVYEPAARVVHVEGATSGTDTSAGSKRHQVRNQPKFVEKWQAALDKQPRPAPDRVRRLSDRNRGMHVLVIDHRIPTPDQDAGSLRMLHLLDELKAQGCRVTFLPDNLVRQEPYSGQLRGMGIEVLDEGIDVWNELNALGPHLRLVIASRPYVASHYMHMLREQAPAAKVAYDTVDLHHVREAGRSRVADDEAASGVAAAMREIELALVRASDCTIVVTREEREHIEREVPGAAVKVIPNAHEISGHVPPPDGREGLLFVGGFEHLPNIDAARYLVRSIMPLVRRELGDVPLTIAGSKPPPEVLALESGGADVTGYLPDLQPLLDRSRVMVAPLRYGAGMKGKVTQSLAAGLPVVTTPTGAEGLDAADGRELLIADDPEGLADAIVRAYRDDELWNRLSAAGQDLVERVCSRATMRERVADLLAGVS